MCQRGMCDMVLRKKCQRKPTIKCHVVQYSLRQRTFCKGAAATKMAFSFYFLAVFRGGNGDG